MSQEKRFEAALVFFDQAFKKKRPTKKETTKKDEDPKKDEDSKKDEDIIKDDDAAAAKNDEDPANEDS